MNMQSSITKVIRDIIDLIELQFQLFSIDAQKAKRASTRAAVFAVGAAALLTPAVTVLLLGLGVLIGELTQWTIGVSVLVVGVISCVIVGVMAMVALHTLGRVSGAMNESKSELVENLKWLKATLVTPSTSPRHQIRSESFDFPPYQSSPIPSDRRWQRSDRSQHSSP